MRIHQERIDRYIVLRINKSKRPLKQKTENNSSFIHIKCVLLISKTRKTTILNITKINHLRVFLSKVPTYQTTPHYKEK